MEENKKVFNGIVAGFIGVFTIILGLKITECPLSFLEIFHFFGIDFIIVLALIYYTRGLIKSQTLITTFMTGIILGVITGAILTVIHIILILCHIDVIIR